MKNSKLQHCFSTLWLCSCLCSRSAEGRRHPGPPCVSQQLHIRAGLHLQAAVPCWTAAIWSLGVQGRHFLFGRTQLHDCQQELWQQDLRVRLRDSYAGKCSCLAAADGCLSQNTTKNLFVMVFFCSLPAAGQPCWTVNPKAQETPISPCWRVHLHSRSQMKVGSPPTSAMCNVCLACAAMILIFKKY